MLLTQDKPFVMKRSDGTYEGMAIDIYNRVTEELKKEGVAIDFIFNEVYTYGSQLRSGRWTGVIGELMKECHHIGVSHHKSYI